MRVLPSAESPALFQTADIWCVPVRSLSVPLWLLRVYVYTYIYIYIYIYIYTYTQYLTVVIRQFRWSKANRALFVKGWTSPGQREVPKTKGSPPEKDKSPDKSQNNNLEIRGFDPSRFLSQGVNPPPGFGAKMSNTFAPLLCARQGAAATRRGCFRTPGEGTGRYYH